MIRDGNARRKRPESVLVLIVAKSGDVLLMERREPAGFWQSVTGSLQEGETLRAAARREVAEETGLTAGPELEDLEMGARFRIAPAWRHRFAPGVRENREHWFRLRLPAAVPVRLNPREHLRYQWLPAAEAAALTASWSNRAAIERYAAPRR